MNKGKMNFAATITTSRSNNKMLECNSETLDKNESMTCTVRTESESCEAQGAVPEVQDGQASVAPQSADYAEQNLDDGKGSLPQIHSIHTTDLAPDDAVLMESMHIQLHKKQAKLASLVRQSQAMMDNGNISEQDLETKQLSVTMPELKPVMGHTLSVQQRMRERLSSMDNTSELKHM